MSGEAWLGYAAPEARGEARLAARSLGIDDLAFIQDADEMRRRVLDSAGTFSVLVGSPPAGVSDINLAAALVRDGAACSVVMVRRAASGSLRSRAARAGVDLVIDPDDLGGEVPGRSSTGVASGVSGPLPNVAPAVNSIPAASDLPARRAGGAPVIVFCSGRGGVGKTALVAATAAAAAGWGLKVAAVDLDLSCGNLYSCFGLPGGFDLVPAAQGGQAQAGAACMEGVRLFGPCERPEQADLVMPAVGRLLADVAGGSDLVLVDTSATFTDAVAQAVQTADRVILVEDGRSGSAAAQARTSGLAARLGVARTRIARLKNRMDPRERRRNAPQLEAGIEGTRALVVLDGGDEVSEFLAAGQVGELVSVGSPFCDSAAAALAQVLEELGRLPDCEAARKAVAANQPKKRAFFGKGRELRSA